MERKFMKRLLEWKDSTQKMPMLLFGARQVGKSYLILDFAKKNYKDYVYLNFEKDQILSSFFDISLDPKSIIDQLNKYFHLQITKETLLIFDEIQICPRAITSLKYFCEEMNEQPVIAAGSLLGVAIHRENISFPVGKVLLEQLYPLDFEEFLMAKDEESLITMIKTCYEEKKPMPDVWHLKAVQYYKEYVLCGGMPAVVLSYLTQSPISYDMIQQNIINAYLADMAKYATPSEAMKIRSCFQSIPEQLSKDNHKFQYKIIEKGATKSKYQDAIEWLMDSGLIIKVSKIKNNLLPMKCYADSDFFKIYMSDTGLLSNLYGLDMSVFIKDEYAIFKGGLTENYVAQQLKTKGYDACYYESNGIAKIDFMITKSHQVIPMEVKASFNTKSKSLKMYMDKYQPEYAIRCSLKNFGNKDGVLYLPLYALFCL